MTKNIGKSEEKNLVNHLNNKKFSDLDYKHKEIISKSFNNIEQIMLV